jgi:hypothetical protein
VAGTFDFCQKSRTAVELPPDNGSPVDFNGWEFTSKPNVPYRRKFTVTLTGLRWYLGNGVLDTTTNPEYNAGRLLDFYRQNQMWDVFAFNHEYLGSILVRFSSPVAIPKAEPSSNGRINPFDVSLIHYNPAF